MKDPGESFSGYNTIERVIFTLTARYYIAPTEFSFLSPGYEHNVKARRISRYIARRVVLNFFVLTGRKIFERKKEYT